MPCDINHHDKEGCASYSANVYSSGDLNSTKQSINKGPSFENYWQYIVSNKNGNTKTKDDNNNKISQSNNVVNESETPNKTSAEHAPCEDGAIRRTRLHVHHKSLSVSDLDLRIENEQKCSKIERRKRFHSEGSTMPLLSPNDLIGDKKIETNSQESEMSTIKEDKNETNDIESTTYDILASKQTNVSQDVKINELEDEYLKNDRKLDYDVDERTSVKTDSTQLLIDEPDRVKECTNCSNNYSELHHKIDFVIHDYQMYNKRVTDIPTSLYWRRSIENAVRKWKYCSILTCTITSIMCCCLLSITIVTRTYSCDVFHGDLRKNMSDSLITLNYQYGTMTKMMQVLTNTRPVIKVTSGDKFSFYDNRYYVAWSGSPNSGQGGLRLSHNGDSIIAERGGYYLITCNLFYMFTNTNSRVELEYDILQKVDSSHSSVVQSAFAQFRANAGHTRQNVETNSVVYLFPGDEIQVGLDPAQRKLTAKFDKAHSLSMFLID